MGQQWVDHDHVNAETLTVVGATWKSVIIDMIM